MDESLALGLGVGFLLFAVIFLAVALAMAVITYVLEGLGMSRTARIKGLSKPWLAWIPFAQNWLFGAIADKIEEENGVKKHYAKIALISMIVYFIFNMTGIFFSSFGEAFIELGYDEIGLVFTAVCLLLNIVSWVSYIVYVVFSWIIIYKIFKHFVPEKTVLYMVLSFFIPFAAGICLIKCAKAYTPIVSEEVSPEA